MLLSAEERASIRVLIIDHEPVCAKACESLLREEGYQCWVEHRAEEALERLNRDRFDIVLIDQDMPDLPDLDILGTVQRRQPESFVVLVASQATSEAAVRAVQAGAWDYLPKPFTPAHLSVLIARTAYTRTRASEVTRQATTADPSHLRDKTIIGVSAPIQEALRRALKVARTDASVFITGETGTGKELIAQLIHRESRRAQKPFVTVNCAALPEQLLESEMFGHRRGSFSGAVLDKVGLLEVAHQGTFFLDEIAEMPIALQAKLLRVLQDGVIRRVGSEKDDFIANVRWISATNRDPEEALDMGLLRRDLFYRLRVIPIHLPPLRERREDIPVLVRHFAQHFWRRHQGAGRLQPRLAHETLEALVWYSWPGNVRELQNIIEHLMALAEPAELVESSRLSFLSKATTRDRVSGQVGYASRISHIAQAIDFQMPFRQAKGTLVDQFEREYLSQAVARSGGNLSKAARTAGIDRTTLYRLMEKHSLSKAGLAPESEPGASNAK